MQNKTRRVLAIVGVGLGLLLSNHMVYAEAVGFDKKLSSQWWQWAASIPTNDNPLLELDTTTEKCMVGQRGDVWFLAGLLGTGAATRKCAVPEGTGLFFPVVNSMFFDSPNECQGPESFSIEELRAAVAATIDAVTNIAVEVDGQPIRNIHRIGRSIVYAVAVPEDNIFDEGCIAGGFPDGLPAGIYSPTVDDGLYVKLNPLSEGNHTLHFRAEGPGGFILQDITYHLTVVPVSLK
jgi:hypothetical protein